MARTDAVQALHGEQREPVGGIVWGDGEDAAGVRDLRGGGRDDGDGRADTDAHVDAVPGDRPQPQHVCKVGGGGGVVAQRAPQVDQRRGVRQRLHHRRQLPS